MRPGYSSSSDNQEEAQSSGDDAYADLGQQKQSFMSPNIGQQYAKGQQQYRQIGKQHFWLKLDIGR